MLGFFVKWEQQLFQRTYGLDLVVNKLQGELCTPSPLQAINWFSRSALRYVHYSHEKQPQPLSYLAFIHTKKTI